MKNVIFLDRVMVVIIGKMKKRIKLKSKSKIFKYYVEWESIEMFVIFVYREFICKKF